MNISKNEILKLALKVAEDDIGPDGYAAINNSLIPLGLARWHNETLVLSEKGKQLIFQHRCKLCLISMLDGTPPPRSDIVRAWLAKHEFIVQMDKASVDWRVTPRGRDWLSQLE